MSFWHWEFAGLHLGTGWLILYALFFAAAGVIETRTTKRPWMMLFNAWACGVNFGRIVFLAALVCM